MTTIDEILKENDREKKELLRLYRRVLFFSQFKPHRELFCEVLKDDMKQFDSEIETFNEYYKLLRRYYYSRDREDVDRILDKIEMEFYDTLEYYKLKADFDNFINPDRLLDLHSDGNARQQLRDEVYGLTLSDYDIDDYFKDGVILSYIRSNLKYFDGGDDLSFYGIFPEIEHGILRKIRMVVPKVHNLKTALINVHEFRHVFDLYELIGKEYPEDNDFEERARKEEDTFIREYLRKK